MQVIIKIVCVFSVFYNFKCSAKLEPLEQPDFKVSLCECLLAASKKYVHQKETITIALPITDYLDNVSSVIPSHQMMLSLLTEEMQWTILTKNMNKHANLTTHLSLERISKSYIIFIRSSGEISDNLKKLKTVNSWNPHSNFFVISATIFQNPLDIAKEILQALWEDHLLDGVVLLANPNNTNLFKVYISEPYAKSNCGKNLGQIKVVDSCNKGIFRRNSYLFNNKIPRRLTNCTLSIGYAKAAPFVLKIRNNNSVDTKEYFHTDNGVEINLMNVIAQFFELKAIYYQGDFGDISLNSTATGNLLTLREGFVDIAIGSYVKSFARSYYFDSSVVYIQDRLVWCVPHTPILINSRNFLEILDFTTWILLLLLYLITTCLFWYVSRSNEKELRPYRDYKNVMQYVLSIFLGLPVRFQPRTLQVRSMFIVIVLFSFHLGSAYQSYLTSVLTGSKYGEKYNSVKEIYEQNLKTYFIPNAEMYFEGEKYQQVLERMRECKNFRKCMNYVAFRRDSAFCVPKMYADYIYNSYVTKSNDPLLHCFGNIVSLSINMLMRKGFPLFSKINELIGRILAGGFIAKWRKDILWSRADYLVGTIEVNESDSQFLKLKNLIPVFLGLITCYFIAFLTFIVELKYGKKLLKVNKN